MAPRSAKHHSSFAKVFGAGLGVWDFGVKLMLIRIRDLQGEGLGFRSLLLSSVKSLPEVTTLHLGVLSRPLPESTEGLKARKVTEPSGRKLQLFWHASNALVSIFI